jgi:hypothetical protein
MRGVSKFATHVGTGMTVVEVRGGALARRTARELDKAITEDVTSDDVKALSDRYKAFVGVALPIVQAARK